MARHRARRRPDPEPRPDCAGAPPGVDPGVADPVCGLCGRPIPPGAPQSLHHLVPKLKGGTHGPTALLHHLCHREIHATLSEAELARGYATLEALRAHPRLARFVEWVARRPPGFASKVPRRKAHR